MLLALLAVPVLVAGALMVARPEVQPAGSAQARLVRSSVPAAEAASLPASASLPDAGSVPARPAGGFDVSALDAVVKEAAVVEEAAVYRLVTGRDHFARIDDFATFAASGMGRRPVVAGADGSVTLGSPDWSGPRLETSPSGRWRFTAPDVPAVGPPPGSRPWAASGLTEADLLAAAEGFLASVGLDRSDPELVGFDASGAVLAAPLVLDGIDTGLETTVVVGPSGEVVSASGFVGRFAPVGSFPLLAVDDVLVDLVADPAPGSAAGSGPVELVDVSVAYRPLWDAAEVAWLVPEFVFTDRAGGRWRALAVAPGLVDGLKVSSEQGPMLFSIVSIAASMLGRSFADAVTLVQDNLLSLRQVDVDGRTFGASREYQPGRISVLVDGGVVVDSFVG